MSEKTKRCSKCGEVKAVGEFYRNQRERDGHSRRCRVCALQDSNRRRKENPEKVREAQSKYKKKNREKLKVQGAAYYKKNQERCRKARRDRRKADIKKALKAERKWATNNREKRLSQARRRHKENPERRRATARKIRAKLSDGYVASHIRLATGLKTSQIPQSVIDCKREYIRLIRLLKEMKS